MEPVLVRPAQWPQDLVAVRRLLHAYFREYQAELGKQDFHDEMAHLDQRYDGKVQRLWVADVGGHVVGCAGLRRIDAATCELKRMVVDPAQRGKGVGKALGDRLLAEARASGHSAVLLDTVGSMKAARRLYERLGFKERGPYYGSPLCGAVFMEAKLA